MEQKELISLLQNPAGITPDQTAALKEVLVEYPFFQAARAVRLKGLKNQNSLHYNKELKITAAYTLDRSVLFDFITSEEFLQNQIAEQIKKQEGPQEKNEEPEAERTKKEIKKEPKDDSLNEALKMKVRQAEQILDPDLFRKFVANSKKEAEEAPDEKETGTQLNLGTPLAFQKTENHSFSEWLKLTKVKPIQRENQNQARDKFKSRKFELIEEFIAKSPKIKPVKSGKKANLAEENFTAPETLMTETLARVYLEQKNYKKAIQAYKILILKNPEKSGFFADQIRAIEKLQEHNS